MAANLSKNPETSKCFGTFFIKKNRKCYFITTLSIRSNSFTFGNESRLSFRSLNHDFLTFLYINTLAGRVDTLAIQVIPSVIVIITSL